LYKKAFPPRSPLQPPKIAETISPRSTIESTDKPVIFIEVEIGDRVETLCAAKTDNAFRRASDFVSRHGLSKASLRPLTELLQSRIDEYAAIEARGTSFVAEHHTPGRLCNEDHSTNTAIRLARSRARERPVIAEISVPVASKGTVALQIHRDEDVRDAVRSFSILYGLRPVDAEATLLAAQKRVGEVLLEEADAC